MRNRDPAPPEQRRRSPTIEVTPASAKLAWPATADADWLRDVRAYDGFVRRLRPD